MQAGSLRSRMANPLLKHTSSFLNSLNPQLWIPELHMAFGPLKSSYDNPSGEQTSLIPSNKLADSSVPHLSMLINYTPKTTMETFFCWDQKPHFVVMSILYTDPCTPLQMVQSGSNCARVPDCCEGWSEWHSSTGEGGGKVSVSAVLGLEAQWLCWWSMTAGGNGPDHWPGSCVPGSTAGQLAQTAYRKIADHSWKHNSAQAVQRLDSQTALCFRTLVIQSASDARAWCK